MAILKLWTLSRLSLTAFSCYFLSLIYLADKKRVEHGYHKKGAISGMIIYYYMVRLLMCIQVDRCLYMMKVP